MFRRIFVLLLILMPSVLFAQTAGEVGGIDAAFLRNSAIENNLELQKLGVEHRQAQIDLQNAEAERFPKVDFQTTLSWMSKPAIEPITLTAGELGSYDIGGQTVLFPTEDMTIYKGTEDTHYEFKFIVDQPVFTWGKITNAISLYGKAAETSELNIRSKETEIKTQVNIYFHSLYYILKIEQSLSQQSADAQRLIDISEESYRNGFILYTDLLQAKIKAKELDIAAAELKEQKEAALLALSKLTGINELDISVFNFSKLTGPDSIKFGSADFYMQQAMKNSPQIQMLGNLRDINELRVEISRGSSVFKPDIGLHFELGYSGPRFPLIETDWFGRDSLNLTSTIALQTSVFDGGKQRLKVEKDLEELEKAYYEYELGAESIKHVLNETLLKLELNRQNIDYYKLLQENDGQQIELKKTQLEAGSGSETDLLSEKINLKVHEINEYRESIDFFKNYFTLLGAASMVY